MPKRPKAKVKTTTTERTPSAAKQRRIAKQSEAEANNQLNGTKPWAIAKNNRIRARKLAGKTYENWRKANSARAQERPTASNLLTERNQKFAVGDLL